MLCHVMCESAGKGDSLAFSTPAFIHSPFREGGEVASLTEQNLRPSSGCSYRAHHAPPRQGRSSPAMWHRGEWRARVGDSYAPMRNVVSLTV